VTPLTDQLSGHIEVDETYFGGKRKGKRGRGAAGKTPVIGIIQRNGSVRTIAIPNVGSATLQALIKEHVEMGSTIYTDGWKATEALVIKGFLISLLITTRHLYHEKGTTPIPLRAIGDYRKTSCTRAITKSLRRIYRTTWQNQTSSLTSDHSLIL
jgi:transposase-like protein